MQASSFEKNKGTIWIHGRILLSLQSESELAALLAHEMGHILALHSLARYKLSPQNKIQKIKRHLEKREEETEADLMAAHLLANAGFDPRAIIAALRRLEGDTQKQGSCPGLLTKFGSLFQGHPLTYDRIKNVEKHLREYPQLSQSERLPECSWEDWKTAIKPHAHLFF